METINQRMEITDPWAAYWADWLKGKAPTTQGKQAPQSYYAIMNFPADGFTGPDVPLDLMTREDLVAHYASESYSPTPPPLSAAAPHRLTIDGRSERCGNKASLFQATFALAGGPLLDVFVKTYPVEDFDLLLREFDVYSAAAHSGIVPKLHATIKCRPQPWGGLIMENAGTALSAYDDPWEDLKLTQRERLELYDALRRLHAAGIVHGDVAARNILRRPTGAFCLVDFERSSLAHVCPGPVCEELARSQRNLGLEDAQVRT
ncbi:hypothetical protein B0H15DRAFT_846801 [Mycena belliarum]|uniref:Protein kinase domain-containing protein n=1 Tax=Mycena belliarum TaxID=1033014 RepID=A0AAD6U5K8_9AGAR|nr:hypothetical protein B0H15DRAFT_846801 [Mycena belliae]